jgi:uncharacterized protein (DUF305 family)
MRLRMSGMTICAVAAVLAGCGDSGQRADATPVPTQKVIQPGAPGEPSREVVATPIPEGFGVKPADIAFMQGMIHHHQQAVTMAGWVPDRTKSTDVRLLAERMAVSQEGEMDLMRNWLEKRGVDPNQHSDGHSTMPGMLTTSQMEKLEAARGKRFDRLFLRYMTQHHQGALTMVQNLVDDGGGAEAEIEQFILHVDADQTIEIQRMQQMLSAL